MILAKFSIFPSFPLILFFFVLFISLNFVRLTKTGKKVIFENGTFFFSFKISVNAHFSSLLGKNDQL